MDQQQKSALLADVRADIQKLEGELAELRRVEFYLARPVSSPTVPSAMTVANGRAPTPAPVQQSPHRFATAIVWEAAQDVLRESRQPMRAMDIAQVILAGGYSTPSDERSFANTVFTSMTRHSDIFAKRGRGEWTLLEFLDQRDEQDE